MGLIKKNKIYMCFFLVLFHSSVYSNSFCDNLQEYLLIMNRLYLSAEQDLTEAQEKYQDCISNKKDTDCLDLETTLLIKVVITLSAEQDLTEAQEKYENCLNSNNTKAL